MAITWLWDEKCGEAVVYSKVQDKEFTLNLYKGNAFLIFINEYKDEKTNEDMYNVYSFFIDEAHAKNCLGLTKGNSNIFNDSVVELREIRLNKDKYSYTSKLVNMLIKAFSNLTIKIYTDTEK